MTIEQELIVRVVKAADNYTDGHKAIEIMTPSTEQQEWIDAMKLLRDYAETIKK